MNFDVWSGWVSSSWILAFGITSGLTPLQPCACIIGANWRTDADLQTLLHNLPLWQLPRWVGIGEDCPCRAFLTHGWVPELLAWRADWTVPLPNMLRTVVTVVPSSQEKLELKHLNYSQIWEAETSTHSALFKMRMKLARRFESNVYSFSCSLLLSPTDFAHHVTLHHLPPPCKTEVCLQEEPPMLQLSMPNIKQLTFLVCFLRQDWYP